MHRISVALLIGMLFLPLGALGQSDPCTLMDLTVQTPITLQELPSLLVETLALPYGVSDLSSPQMKVNIWLKVLHRNQKANGEKLEIFFNKLPVLTLPANGWPTIWTDEGWHLLPVNVSVGEPIAGAIEIKSYTRTDVPDRKPTTILIGAVQLAGTELTGGPDQADTLKKAVYQSELTQSGLTIPGAYKITADGIAGEAQRYTARLGGIGAPRLSASVRFNAGVGAEGASKH